MKLFSPLLQFGRLSLMTGLILSLTAATALAGYQPRPRGLPAHRVSGGTRDPIPACTSATPQLLTAITPEDVGATTAAYPTFHWYMPENTASHLEFRLYEAQPEQDVFTPIYQAAFAISGKAGISTLHLPAAAGISPLSVGKIYYWSIEVYCEAEGDQADMTVDSWIERITINADQQSQLDQATNPTEQALVAAENSLWFDAVAILSEQLRLAPNDARAQQAWQTLLASVGLTTIADQPLIKP